WFRAYRADEDLLAGILCQQHLEQLDGGLSIAIGPVPVAHGNSQSPGKFPEAVGGLARHKFLRQFHGTQTFPFVFKSESAEFCRKNAVIEFCVMGYQNAVGSNFHDPLCHLKEFRGISKHLVVNSCESNHKRLDRDLRINKANKLVYDFMAIESVYGYLGNSFFIILPAGSFYV